MQVCCRVVGVNYKPLDVQKQQRIARTTEEVVVGEGGRVGVVYFNRGRCVRHGRRVCPEDGHYTGLLVARVELEALDVRSDPDIPRVGDAELDWAVPSEGQSRGLAHLVAGDVAAAQDGDEVGPWSADGVGGGHAENALGMRVPAHDDARAIHDHNSGFQLIQQLDVLICQYLNHALPPGARWIRRPPVGASDRRPLS